MGHDYRPGRDGTTMRLDAAPVWIDHVPIRRRRWPYVVTLCVGVVLGACAVQLKNTLTVGEAHPNEKTTVAAILKCEASGKVWEMGKCW